MKKCEAVNEGVEGEDKMIRSEREGNGKTVPAPMGKCLGITAVRYPVAHVRGD